MTDDNVTPTRPTEPRQYQRLNVNLSETGAENIRWLRGRLDLNATDTVHRALALLRWWEEQVKDGNEHLVRDRNGDMARVVSFG